MRLYPYQEDLRTALLSGKSVVLQAPTGAGKTLAALAPFVDAFAKEPMDAFPKQCIYSVPVRVLAGQFYETFSRMIEVTSPDAANSVTHSIQTGDRPEDPQLMRDVIFATIDQTLSSAFGVPYSLSAGMANINVGAVFASYLVFDEFHLYPPQALTSTLVLLELIGRVTPFTLMTATFSHQMLTGLADRLSAHVLRVSEEEANLIETQWGTRPRKSRRYECVPEVLSSKRVLEQHEGRSLVVCNTVDRAIQLYDELIAAGCRPVPFGAIEMPTDRTSSTGEPATRRGALDRAVEGLLAQVLEHGATTPWVMLLHSRFERRHRQLKERLLQRLWSREAIERPQQPSVIVVATQVVEVGLDISADQLHTEIAPAASVFQRAGRCARYPGQQGVVWVYDVPRKADGEASFEPYGNSELERDVCRRSWEAFAARQGCVLGFAQEQEVIDEAHTAADEALLQSLDNAKASVLDNVISALAYGERKARSELIRRADSRTVVVVDPATPVGDPFQLEGIAVWQGILAGLQKRTISLCQELDLPWGLAYPAESQTDAEDEPRYEWCPAVEPADLNCSPIIAVHARLASYDAERGLRLGVASGGQYRSPAIHLPPARPDYGGYQLECYATHVGSMCRIFAGAPDSGQAEAMGRFRRRLAWVERRLAALDGPWHVEPGMLERAVRLALALHDLGKLDVRWQAFASEYQRRIGEGSPACLLAHTHFEKSNPAHAGAERELRHLRPRSHAGEGALASLRLLVEALDGRTQPQLVKATLAAIARHHSVDLKQASPYELHPDATATVADALAHVAPTEAEVQLWRAWARHVRLSDPAPHLEKYLPESPPGEEWSTWFLYFLIVRYVRLCDQMSQEKDK